MKRFDKLPTLEKWELIRDLWLQVSGATATFIMSFGFTDKTNAIVTAGMVWVGMILSGVCSYLRRLEGKKDEE